MVCRNLAALPQDFLPEFQSEYQGHSRSPIVQMRLQVPCVLLQSLNRTLYDPVRILRSNGCLSNDSRGSSPRHTHIAHEMVGSVSPHSPIKSRENDGPLHLREILQNHKDDSIFLLCLHGNTKLCDIPTHSVHYPSSLSRGSYPCHFPGRSAGSTSCMVGESVGVPTLLPSSAPSGSACALILVLILTRGIPFLPPLIFLPVRRKRLHCITTPDGLAKPDSSISTKLASMTKDPPLGFVTICLPDSMFKMKLFPQALSPPNIRHLELQPDDVAAARK